MYNRNFLMLLFLTGESNKFKEENFRKYLDKDQNNQFTKQNFLLFNDLLHLMKLPDISATVKTKSSCCLYHLIILHYSICLKSVSGHLLFNFVNVEVVSHKTCCFGELMAT